MHYLRSLVAVSILLWTVGLSGCPGEDPVDDAGTEVLLGCGNDLAFPDLTWSRSSVGMEVGQSRTLRIGFVRDCFTGTTITITSDGTGVDFPASLTIPGDFDRGELVLTGTAIGTQTLTAEATHESGDTVSATLEVTVIATDEPFTCTGEQTATVAPGDSTELDLGGGYRAVLAIPEGAARDDQYQVDPIAATIRCGTELSIAGYEPLGPAIEFGPTHMRLAREIPLTIPIRLASLPTDGTLAHVQVAYLGPRETEARLVGVASPRYAGSAAGGTMTFETPRLGTYQAMARPPVRRIRNFTFRAILGFSMGGSGSGRIGFGNPEIFDFVSPLGGPTDWTYMLEQMRSNHIGGFCTEDERVADPSGCAAGASLDRVPPPTEMHAHAQHFESWWYVDEYEGQGGTFTRQDYISIFRDLATMFGNPNYDRTTDPTLPNITPPGVPDSERGRPASERCMPGNQIVIPPFDGTGNPESGSENAGFFDDEFNREGTYPVITFCDGAQLDGDIGLWDPNGVQGVPTEIILAVDINGDGVRNAGEPVIRNGREPFDDFGLDGIPNTAEVSADGTPYDAVTNPDPAGDDFEFQFNPSGTENNWERDTIDGDPCRPPEAGMAEAFLDSGIDGVVGTRQLTATDDLLGGGFDVGEGNGCFDRTAGARNMIESSPRWLAERMDRDTLVDTDLYADGGIRDLFNWVVMGNVTTAGWANRDLPMTYFNGHAALHLNNAGDFDYFDVPWEDIGRYTMIRYGSPDASQTFIEIGDGGHVGTTQQLVDRLRSALMMMDARWPNGERTRITNDRVCARSDLELCGYINQFVFDFTATTGRTGPVSLVLPPGYFAEENADQRYPVAYFLHGYGMTPEDLVALGLLMWADMNNPRAGSSRRMQKMILVFPDGRCRGNECIRGTFYTDAPDNVPDGAQMQTFLLDLMDHVDENYRTQNPSAHEIIE